MSHYTKEDIQHISDMRLIAQAKLERFKNDQRFTHGASAMRRIIDMCESLIKLGPAEFHHVLEPSVSVADAQKELHVSVFGHQPLVRNG